MDGGNGREIRRKLLLTSLGLFFAGATPVKSERRGENRQKRRLPEQFIVHVQMKKQQKLSNVSADSQTKRCPSSLQLPPLFSGCIVPLLAHPRLAFEEEERGEKGVGVASASICITTVANAWLDWCSERAAPAPRANPPLTRPWLPSSGSARLTAMKE